MSTPPIVPDASNGRSESLRRIIPLFGLLSILVPAFGQDLSALDRWVPGFPSGQVSLNGHRITRCVLERSGALLIIDRSGLPVRFNLLKPVPFASLTARLTLVERTLLAPRELVAEKWSIAFTSGEIDFGLQDEMTVTLRPASFRLRLNPGTLLELAGRFTDEPVFHCPADGDRFTYTIRLKGIGPGTGQRDLFPGWPEYMKKLNAWFESGLDAKNQEIMAIVLDSRIMSQREKQDQKRVVLSKDTRSNFRVGMTFDYFMSNLVSAEDFRVHLRPAAYHLLQPMAFVSWRNLGDPAWLARPFQVTVGLGAFFEFNAGYFTRSLDTSDIISTYPLANGSFIYACGPSLRIEFSAMIPRIVDNRYADDLYGIGLELLTLLNVPYFFPDYFYEYFLNQYINFLLHILPGEQNGFDVIIGINFALQTLGLDESSGLVLLGKYALSVGVRFRLDLYTAYASDQMFE